MSKLSCACKSSDRVWGIVSPTLKRLHRLTFSRSLAEWIVGKCTEGVRYESRPFKYVRSKRLAPGEISESGIYALVSTKKDLVLRITMFKDSAELMSDESRHIEEVYLVPEVEG